MIIILGRIKVYLVSVVKYLGAFVKNEFNIKIIKTILITIQIINK